jgi:hypothetical protein
LHENGTYYIIKDTMGFDFKALHRI